MPLESYKIRIFASLRGYYRHLVHRLSTEFAAVDTVGVGRRGSVYRTMDFSFFRHDVGRCGMDIKVEIIACFFDHLCDKRNISHG